MEKTEILSNSNYIEEYFLEGYKKFVYLEEKYITEYIPNIEVMNWKEYKLYLKEEITVFWSRLFYSFSFNFR